MANKKVTTAKNAFSRWFRNKLRDPIIESVLNNSRVKSGAKEAILGELPFMLYDLIVTNEGDKSKSGIEKFWALSQAVYGKLKQYGLEILWPVLVPILQEAVMKIYAEYFMLKFKAWGIHNAVEQIFNKDIDKDGSIGSAPPVPVKEVSSFKEPFVPTKKKKDNPLSGGLDVVPDD